MIGDNPESDIAGAIRKGWTSILVKTGVFDPNAATSINGNDRKFPATYVVEDFPEAIDLIFRLEKEGKESILTNKKPELNLVTPYPVIGKNDKPEVMAQQVKGDAFGKIEEKKQNEMTMLATPMV